MKRTRSNEADGKQAKVGKTAENGATNLFQAPLTSELEYVHGIGGGRSEALPDCIPKGQNNPQRCPYDLYAEKLSGTAFTAPRHKNMQTWLYRIRPSVQHTPFEKCKDVGTHIVSNFDAKDGSVKADPNQIRWMPMDVPTAATDFVAGLYTVGGSGSPEAYTGFAVHNYVANKSMEDSCFMNSDGDFLIVPQEGPLRVVTELGVMDVSPCEICVVQRGIRFAVQVSGPSRGYVLEVFCRHFTLPELGPIGSYGLANAQDFRQPTAAYEDREVKGFRFVNKFCGELFEAKQDFSPFNVVAWTGTYVPFKYDLRKFMCINSVTYDHPDPSIYTVLTCPSDEPGVAVADFVIFPPRWMPQEHTFRPPWYHRNCMSEYMGMIWGQYDAKLSESKSSGFVPGGSTIHNWMTPHGPDQGAFDKATSAKLEPHFFDKGLAFMFESKFAMKLTAHALTDPHRDHDYYKCWQSLPKKFSSWVPTDGEHLAEWQAAEKK